MNGVDPPANPTSLGNVWRGETRPLQGLDELQRLRAMERRLLEWADQLEANRDKPGDVGKFIAAELRNRMAGLHEGIDQIHHRNMQLQGARVSLIWFQRPDGLWNADCTCGGSCCGIRFDERAACEERHFQRAAEDRENGHKYPPCGPKFLRRQRQRAERSDHR